MRFLTVSFALACVLVASCATPQPPSMSPAVTRERTADAAAPLCPRHFAGRQAPTLLERTDAGELVELCYTHFSVMHASGFRTPIWSAEHLTRAMGEAGETFGGRPGYHVENQLDAEDRASTRDYRNTGFDVGHMTPSDDMPDRDTQWETFTLANMVPQAGPLNRVTWQGLEASINEYAEQQGELYIVTGPIYSSRPRRLNERVAVPQAVFKAVYDPATETALVFVAENRPDARCRIISVNDLTERVGFEVFPGLADLDRDNVTPWQLPPGPRTPVPDCRH